MIRTVHSNGRNWRNTIGGDLNFVRRYTHVWKQVSISSEQKSGELRPTSLQKSRRLLHILRVNHIFKHVVTVCCHECVKECQEFVKIKSIDDTDKKLR